MSPTLLTAEPPVRLFAPSTNRIKRADQAGDDADSFERSFASLAYTYVKNKSPRLLDYIVGFQVVERDEDETKAVGAFGFQVGDMWLLAPVFFLGGKLKGHELLILPKENIFIPQKENWVNYLLAKKPNLLGRSAPRDLHSKGVAHPALRGMLGFPYAKYGSDPGPMDLMLAAARADSARFLDVHHFRKEAESLDLESFLVARPELRRTARQGFYEANPTIKQAFDRHYGFDFFQRVEAKLAARALDLTAKLADAPPVTFADVLDRAEGKRKEASARVTVIIRTGDMQFSEPTDDLTDTERSKLLREGQVVKDRRKDEEKSIAYRKRGPLRIVNPGDTGLYDVLLRDGSVRKLVILAGCHDVQGEVGGEVLLVGPESPHEASRHDKDQVWTLNQYLPAEYEEWRSKQKKAATVLDSGNDGWRDAIVLLGDRGQSTVPFSVREKGDGEYDILTTILPGHSPSCYDHGQPHNRYHNYSSRPWKPVLQRAIPSIEDAAMGCPHRLRLLPASQTRLQSRQSEIWVPDDFLGIKVERKEGKFPLGRPEDADRALHEKLASLELQDLGGLMYGIKEGMDDPLPATRWQALAWMVQRHGLAEKDAEDFFAEAKTLQPLHQNAARWVKYGLSPAFPESQQGSEQTRGGQVNALYSQREYQKVPEMSSANSDPGAYDPYYQPDRHAVQAAQTAAQSGQKEVFDVSVIAGLLKTSNPLRLVDDDLGAPMRALDWAGRLLFAFFAHQEAFKDRYGASELPEMEDAIRNTFESLGDLVLYMKEKKVDGGEGLDELGETQTDADPSVDDIAHGF